jgi:hypothetical protein
MKENIASREERRDEKESELYQDSKQIVHVLI